jgi:hypothetical protein
MQQEDTLVPIPTALYLRVQTALEHLEGSTVADFVTDAVRVALAKYENISTADPAGEAQIVERLRRLGYID